MGIKTVSRAINNEPHVSPATMQRVMDAAHAVGYRPNVHAGNLRRSDRRTQTIGLLVSSVDNPFAGALHRAIEDVAWDRGVTVLASSVDDNPRREREAVEMFLRRRVDGLIVTTVTPDQSYLSEESGRGTPIVFVDREAHGVVADSVVSDNFEASARATTHLLEHGHRRIAYLGFRREIRTEIERLRGYTEALDRAGAAVDPGLVVENLRGSDTAFGALNRMLDTADPPTAVFSAQNLMTFGAIRALKGRGLHRDFALVGFDDFPLADVFDPGISVVAQHPEALGRVAAERLFSRISGEVSPARRVEIKTTFIPRGSGEIQAPE
ncbi:LacI family DNA-binding transcriptional regulator [Zhihengliuella somnathii]